MLANGHWILVYNDLEQGRYSLAVSISEDEGATWPWTRHLERDPPAHSRIRSSCGQYHYPSIIQARDGTLHATYSYFIPPAAAKKDDQGRVIRKSIKHAHFNEAWITSRIVAVHLGARQVVQLGVVHPLVDARRAPCRARRSPRAPCADPRPASA